MAKLKKQKRKNSALISKVNMNIKIRREEIGMSQKQLEAVTRLKMYKYESGNKEMTITTIGIIADALQTESYKLFM